ncbi:MAG TPA: carboxymuconolactone decarboxylase family protein [Kofleriaceae bacterium]
MNARLDISKVASDVFPPLVALGKTLAASPIPAKTRGLVHLRTSQINGCAACIDMEIAKTTETPQRLAAVAAWRDAPFFSDAERAALALAEAVTRIADVSDRVPDDVWAEAARHYDEPQLAWLVVEISTMNLYNRLNVATRQVAGAQRY